MRFCVVFSVCLLGLGHSSFANGYALQERDIPLTAPNCSTKCLSTYVPQFCGVAPNLTCLCTNTNLTAAVTLCAMQSCRVPDLLQLQRYTAVSCGVPNDKSRMDMVLHITYVIPFLTTLFLVARLYGKILLKIKLGADDWVMVAAFVTYLLDVGCSLAMVVNGFGEHVYWLSTEQIIAALKWFYVAELFYILSNTFSKLSMLLFFLRIFDNRTFRLQVHALSLFVTLTGASLFFGLVFQCTPISGYWTNWYLPPAEKTKCIAQFALLNTGSALSITQNILILILPIPTLWKLELSTKRRINACLMFSVGSGVVVFSFLRLPSLARLKSSQDISYEQTPIIVYTHLEQAFGIICASLPACRSLLEYFFPSLKLKVADLPCSNFHKLHNSTISSHKSPLEDTRRQTSSQYLIKLRDLEALANAGRGREGGGKEHRMYKGGQSHQSTTTLGSGATCENK